MPWAIGAAGTLVQVLLLIAAVGFAVLALRLLRHPPGRAVDGTIRDLALAAAVAMIVVLTLLTPSTPDETQQIVLVPFRDLFDALDSRGGIRAPIAELVGNLVLFIPLGMALHWRFPRFGLAHVTAVALAVSVAVEVLQALSGTGRWADITDVIMNTLGGTCGALLAGIGQAQTSDDQGR